jgi:hypothetical protein
MGCGDLRPPKRQIGLPGDPDSVATTVGLSFAGSRGSGGAAEEPNPGEQNPGVAKAWNWCLENASYLRFIRHFGFPACQLFGVSVLIFLLVLAWRVLP